MDTHRSDADVWKLNQLHKVNNCNNCAKFVSGKCKVFGYQMPYPAIDCGNKWEDRGKRV